MKAVTLKDIGFNAIMRYRRLQRIGKGSFFEVNRYGSLFVVEKKRLYGNSK